MTIELRHLRYVVAAAEHGSFRRAANALNIHESAISRRIRDLEDDIGSKLFVRYHGGVSLTEAGQNFLVSARRALTQVGRAAFDAASFGKGEAGIVRIGLFSSLSSGFLAELLHAYVVSNPSILCRFIDGGPNGHIRAVQSNELDIAFLTGMPDAEGCDALHLWDERVFAALPTNDRLSLKREVLWADVRGRQFIVSETDPGPEIHDYLLKHLSDLGHRPTVHRHDVGRDNLINLVSMGQGLTLTSEATTKARVPGVVYRPLKDAILPFSAIWRSENCNPAMRKLLSLAKTMSERALPCMLVLLGLQYLQLPF